MHVSETKLTKEIVKVLGLIRPQQKDIYKSQDLNNLS